MNDKGKLFSGISAIILRAKIRILERKFNCEASTISLPVVMEKRSILDHFQVTSGHSLSLTDNSEIHKGHKMKSNKLSRAYLKRFASSMNGLLSTSVSSFQSAPSRLEISELCILGFSCAIFLRWPRDQTMKAFIGLLM